MRRLKVNLLSREYDICIGEGILSNAAELIREIYSGNKTAIVTDSNVCPLYAERFSDVLRKSGIATNTITIPAGEHSKSFECLDTLYNNFFDMELTRSNLVIAIGGGVVGDLTGYAASTFQRGVPFVQVPTSLLAQVDSSVGGKVAVNHPRGKNQIGTFYQPKMVISDTACLETLDKRELASGYAEVIKHGAIADAEFFSQLENRQADMTEIVTKCCEIKLNVVEQDEYDTGLRMTLNFGHTFGHAIEKFYNFNVYNHGEAVAIGMVMACETGEKLGITEKGTAQRMKNVLKTYNLPVSADLDTKALINNILLDKKRGGDAISFVLLDRIGHCRLHKIEVSELGDIL